MEAMQITTSALSSEWPSPKTKHSNSWTECAEKGMRPVGRNLSWYSHYGKHVGSFLKKRKLQVPYYPTIPLLSSSWNTKFGRIYPPQ